MKNLFLKEERYDDVSWLPSDDVSNKLLKYPLALKPKDIDNSVQTGYTVMIDLKSSSVFGPDCGLIGVIANVYDENGENFGKLVKYQTKLGTTFTEYISDEDLLSDTKALIKLVRKGYVLSSNKKIIQYLQDLIRSFNTEQFVPYSSQTGYSKCFHGFVLPDGLYTSDGKHAIVYDSDANNTLALDMGGNYEEWKTEIADKVVGSMIPSFAIIYPFLAFLLPFVDLGTIFVHFFGLSSRGKTLLLQIAASVHGNGADPRNSSDSLISSWNTTAVGLEGMSLLYNGSIGLFDELHECDDKTFASLIHMASNGKTKARAHTNGVLQKRGGWLFPALSSGEQSSLEKIKSAGSEAKLGKLIRFVDVQVEGQIFSGIDEGLAEVFASQLKKMCGTHYGFASRDFMQQFLALAENHEDLSKIINDEFDVIYIQMAKLDLPNEQKRVLRHISLIVLAGYYAVRFKILSMTENQVLESVTHVFNLWTEYMDQTARKVDYVEVLQGEILKSIHLYQNARDTKPKAKIKGYFKETPSGEPNVYLLTQETFEAIFKDVDLGVVRKILVKKGVLLPDTSSKQYKRRHRISSIIGHDGSSYIGRFYTIHAAILDGKEYADDPDLGKSDFEKMIEKMQDKSNPTDQGFKNSNPDTVV